MVFDTLTLDGRAGGTVEIKETHSAYDKCKGVGKGGRGGGGRQGVLKTPRLMLLTFC